MNKKLLTIISILLISKVLVAQNEVGKTDISFGLGGSLLGFYFSAEEFSPGATTRVSPVINISADHCIQNNFSVGLTASYQRFRLDYTDYQWYNEVDSAFVSSDFFEGISRTNISIRMLGHFNVGTFKPRFDPYFGMRIGYSLWRYNHDAPNPEWQELDLDRNWLSLQLLIGAKVYFTDKIGMHFEAGVGTPYLFATGLNYKFGTTRTN